MSHSISPKNGFLITTILMPSQGNEDSNRRRTTVTSITVYFPTISKRVPPTCVSRHRLLSSSLGRSSSAQRCHTCVRPTADRAPHDTAPGPPVFRSRLTPVESPSSPLSPRLDVVGSHSVVSPRVTLPTRRRPEHRAAAASTLRFGPSPPRLARRVPSGGRTRPPSSASAAHHAGCRRPADCGSSMATAARAGRRGRRRRRPAVTRHAGRGWGMGLLPPAYLMGGGRCVPALVGHCRSFCRRVELVDGDWRGRLFRRADRERA